jgi:hypothetical protein
MPPILASSLFEIFLYLTAGTIFLAILVAGLAVVVWLVAGLTFSATHPGPVRAAALDRTTGNHGQSAKQSGVS